MDRRIGQRFKHLVKVASFAAATLLLAACVPNVPFRTSIGECPGVCRTASIEHVMPATGVD